jgi:hypothetical protein
MQKLKRFLYWTCPSLLCLLLYWNGLRSWFQMDDFAWLALHLRVHDLNSFLEAMFRPYAQGTIRPISERLFFMGFFSLFGMNALPFHIAMFCTQFVNLILVAIIMRRLTGSAVAGFAAPMLWVVNYNIHWPLTWTSAYNQILCSTVLLLAFYWFLRFTETGLRKYYVRQWAVFLIGFGVLELVVVYPAIAAVFALLRARSYLKHTLPMFVVSAVYAVIHHAVRPPAETNVYTMFFDASLFDTLFTYCLWVVGPHGTGVFYHILEAAVGTALIAFLIVLLRKRDWLPLFFLGWFLIALAPYLPLRNHISDYYLTIPAIGVAMLGAYALSLASKSRVSQVAATVVVLAYAAPSMWKAQEETRRNYTVFKRVQNFVERLAYAHKRNPGKTILIKGMDTELFWSAFYDRPYQIFGLTDVFATGESQAQIDPSGGRPIARYFLAETVSYAGILRGDIVVYEVVGEHLRNITALYRGILAAKELRQLPSALDAGAPMYQTHFREGWYPAEHGHRWMTKRASLEIGAPDRAGAVLKVTGFWPEERVKTGDIELTVSIDGRTYPPSRIDDSNTRFSFAYPLPPGSENKRALQVKLEVDKTVTMPPDTRELGLAFGRFEISR